MKYRHCDGKLELKVTNDRVVRRCLSLTSQRPMLSFLFR